MLVTKASEVNICNKPSDMMMMNGVLFRMPLSSLQKSVVNCRRRALREKFIATLGSAMLENDGAGGASDAIAFAFCTRSVKEKRK